LMQDKLRRDLMFTLRPSTAICEAVAALAEDVQRSRDIISAAAMLDLAPIARTGEAIALALASAAQFGAAGRLADAYVGSAAGHAIAASAFRLPPEPEHLHVVLHVHVVRDAGDAPRFDAAEEEPREWEN
jgi:hypothetical protein